MCKLFGKEAARSVGYLAKKLQGKVGHEPCVCLLLERMLEKGENGCFTRCEND